jgi:hypothetical protein
VLLLAMQHLSYHNPNPWPDFIQRNDLNTGLFLRTCLGRGHLQKGTILSNQFIHYIHTYTSITNLGIIISSKVAQKETRRLLRFGLLS